jgi:hypothetical protein
MVVEALRPARYQRLKLAAALVLLNASLTFDNLWPTPLVRWGSALSLELAVCLLLVCVTAWAARRISPTMVHLAAGVWLLLVLGRYAQVTAPALYGRDINLYWDFQYLPDVVAMGVRVAPLWLVVLVVGIAVLVLALLFAAIAWGFRQLAIAAYGRGQRLMLIGAAVAVILISLTRSPVAFDRQYVATPVVEAYAHQIALMIEARDQSRPVAQSPPMATTLAAVNGADIFLVFVEAYGAVSFDRPEFAEPLSASRSALLADIHDTRRQVVSALVESPTFGGSSWLAHISLLSGVQVRDQNSNARMMRQRRETLVHVFREHGYRTVALMPGLRQVWPEGAFYQFDDIYGAARLDYRGPEFGWFAVPDQFTLERIDALEVRHADRAPLFLFFPTISTHFPFSPTPPYQPDWRRFEEPPPVFDGPDVARAYANQPDWDNFGPGYVRALSYDYASLGGYLRQQTGRDLVMILVGDHQPAAAVSGEGAAWDVPVHIVSGRHELIDRLLARGFKAGLTPSRPRLTSMAGLLPILLDAFGSD